MTAKKLYQTEKDVNKQLFDLGLINHVEKIAKDIRVKYLYFTQLRDSQ